MPLSKEGVNLTSQTKYFLVSRHRELYETRINLSLLALRESLFSSIEVLGDNSTVVFLS